MKMTVDLTGMREIEQTLKSLPIEVSRRDLGLRALYVGAEALAQTARAIVHVEEGDLRESIDASDKLNPTNAPEAGDIAPLEVHVGPSGKFQPGIGVMEEFGTPAHTVHAGKKGVLADKAGDGFFGMEADIPARAPHPFMRPAWDTMQKRVLDLIGGQLGIEVEEAAKKAGR